MINLLPSAEKENIILNRKRNIAIILWGLFLFLIICFIAALFFSRTYLNIILSSQKAILADYEKQFGRPEIRQFEEKIRFINGTIAKLNSFYEKENSLTEILEKVSKTIPPNLHINSFSVVTYVDKEKDKEKGNNFLQVAVSGRSLTREALLELRQKLLQESYFTEVYFPLANWTKSENIDFSVSFKILK